MPEIRGKQVMVYIEYTFFEAMQKALEEDDMSTSTYIRALIVEDLLKRGIITDKQVAQVALGRAS